MMPHNAATGARYRGINTIMLGMSPLAFISGDPRWATYKQAADRGWQVRKGSRGTPGFFYKKIEVEDRTGASDDGRKVVPVLRSFTLFNGSQIDGIPPYIAPGVEEAPWREPESAATIARNSKAVIRVGGDRAFFSPSTDHIQMPPTCAFRSPAAYASVLLHELGHNAASRIMPHDRSDCPPSREPDLNDIGIKRRSLLDMRRCQFRIGLMHRKVRSVLQPERNDCDITIRDGRSGRLRGRVAATPSSAVRGRPQSPRLQVLDASPIRGSRVTLLCGGRGAWSRR
jgi:hypothetical protein